MRGGSDSSSSSICIDFHVEPNDKVKQICSGGYTLAPKPCERTASLGGCQKGNLTNWYYTSSRHANADAVKAECPDDYLAPAP